MTAGIIVFANQINREIIYIGIITIYKRLTFVNLRDICFINSRMGLLRSDSPFPNLQAQNTTFKNKGYS